ncbi:MAG: hypothetical protein KF883_07585 [Thermomicrobiales bacterium]|nr:hypothetical protein [Thermomicrobiales bacterium]
MTDAESTTRAQQRWQALGAIAAAHVHGLAGQGSFDDEVRETLIGACDNISRSIPDAPSLLDAVIAFDEHLDALVPSQLKGVASMGRGSAEICHGVARLMIRAELTQTARAALDLSDALLRMAGVHLVTMLPIWAGNQPLQPTTLAGLLGGPVGRLARGVDVCEFAIGQVNQSPLGGGIGASSRFAPDRAELAAALGFDKPVNSVFDAVSATDYLATAASAAESVASAGEMALQLVNQVLLTQPDAFVFPDEGSGRLPDVPQYRRPRQVDAGFSLVRRVRHSASGVRQWAATVPVGPQLEIDEPLDACLDAISVTRELLSLLTDLFSGGFEINRAVLGNRSGKGHLTSSDIVDFLVIEEGISPADARIIAARVLAHLRVNGLEIAAIDRNMIDAAGLLVLGREIGIEFETLSKYLAPRRFIEGRTADGAPAPSAMRDWLTHETASVKRRKTSVDGLQQRWNDAMALAGSRTPEGVS